MPRGSLLGSRLQVGYGPYRLSRFRPVQSELGSGDLKSSYAVRRVQQRRDPAMELSTASIWEGVRLGFVLADAAVTERVLAFKAEGSTNGFASMVVGTFMKTGGLAAHIQTLRAAYRERRDAMYEALAREMPAGVTWTRTQGGFFLWLTVPARADMGKVNAKAAEERIVALAGTECFPDDRGTHNLRLAFSLQPPEKIAEGIRRLGQAIRAGL